MRSSPDVRCFLADEDHPIFPEDPVWQAPLPDLHERPFEDPEISNAGRVTHADYFTAVHRFVSRQQFAVASAAVANETGRNVSGEAIRAVHVFLEKHGAVYSPSRVMIQVADRWLPMAVNVAVSPEGCRMIDGERRIIDRLNREVPNPWLPRVFGSAAIRTPSGRCLPMFAGKWFDGFHEFHPSTLPGSDTVSLRLWHPTDGRRFLNGRQTFSVYRQAAKILTAFYRPETFEQVAMWHHAAGDFIAGVAEDGGVSLRLVTVRSYGPMLREDARDPAAVFEGLLIFLLQLSLRNRLDRMDGTGAMWWAPNGSVAATLEGFFLGMAFRARRGLVPEELAGLFFRYLSGISLEQMGALAEAVIHRLPSAMPGKDLMRCRLASHIQLLGQAVSGMPHPGEGPRQHHIL